MHCVRMNGSMIYSSSTSDDFRILSPDDLIFTWCTKGQEDTTVSRWLYNVFEAVLALHVLLKAYVYPERMKTR